MNPRSTTRTVPCDRGQARDRLRAARAYLDLAEVAGADDDLTAHQREALVGNAVLAGIAACDAICGLALGEYSRGQDHTQATYLLERVRSVDRALLARFTRLIALKGNAHYSAVTISPEQAKQSLKTARDLVAAAAVVGG